MHLRSRCEGNTQQVGKYQEHTATMWELLSEASKKAVKHARKTAKAD